MPYAISKHKNSTKTPKVGAKINKRPRAIMTIMSVKNPSSIRKRAMTMRTQRATVLIL